MLQAFKNLPSGGEVQRVHLLPIAAVGFELTPIEIGRKPTLLLKKQHLARVNCQGPAHSDRLGACRISPHKAVKWD